NEWLATPAITSAANSLESLLVPLVMMLHSCVVVFIILMAKAPGPDSITGSPTPPTVPEQFRVPLVGLESRAFGDKPMRVA
ncbi:Uncharacterized protein ALO79_01084, partial [Pseudomonas syringae pv. castaneae]